ncbi:MAG: hypothetical protein QNJ65_10810 [Xenococcaceae cyanobacterium MO_234.B1]|nr:hypothetical protein [Xenococcaceae cyanobacterium MO_234.B1]
MEVWRSLFAELLSRRDREKGKTFIFGDRQSQIFFSKYERQLEKAIAKVAKCRNLFDYIKKYL